MAVATLNELKEFYEYAIILDFEKKRVWKIRDGELKIYPEKYFRDFCLAIGVEMDEETLLKQDTFSVPEGGILLKLIESFSKAIIIDVKNKEMTNVINRKIKVYPSKYFDRIGKGELNFFDLTDDRN